jgi:hypothetical protein
MRTKLYIIAAITCFLSIETAYSQFDRKVTFNAFLGYFKPLGTKISPDSVPFIFPNFKNGGQLGIGVQYNVSPSFSLGFNASSSLSVKYVDPLPLTSSADKGEGDNYKSRFTIFNIGIDFRYKFLASKKVSPYIYGEVNLNFYNAKVQPHYTFINQNQPYDPYDPNGIDNKYTIARYNAREVSSVAFGLTGGAGVDLKISNTFVLFVQGGYNIKFTQGNDIMLANLNFINANAGLRFSLFKSKSLL